MMLLSVFAPNANLPTFCAVSIAPDSALRSCGVVVSSIIAEALALMAFAIAKSSALKASNSADLSITDDSREAVITFADSCLRSASHFSLAALRIIPAAFMPCLSASSRIVIDDVTYSTRSRFQSVAIGIQDRCDHQAMLSHWSLRSDGDR